MFAEVLSLPDPKETWLPMLGSYFCLVDIGYSNTFLAVDVRRLFSGALKSK